MIPTFFIVGAPRCGTTSLYRYLERHPQVFVAKLKEPHHFGSDLEIQPRPLASREAYLALFEGAHDAKHAGEGSVLYLYSRTAPAEILALNPDARVIILLRDPVEFIPSLHAHNLLLGFENIRDLGRALEAEPERRQGRRIPAGCIAPLALQYTTLARYSDHVLRYQEAFGRDRVLCLLLEDLRERPDEVCERTMSFLQLEESGPLELDRLNPRRHWRHQGLGQGMLATLRHADRITRRFPGQLLRLSTLAAVAGLLYLPLRLNTGAASPIALPPALYRDLRPQLRGEVERLGEILGRDLSAWSNADAGPGG